MKPRIGMTSTHKSIPQICSRLVRRGFDRRFYWDSSGLHLVGAERTFKPAQLYLREYHRVQDEEQTGESVYALETRDGLRGLVRNHFEGFSDIRLRKFMDRVRVITPTS